MKIVGKLEPVDSNRFVCNCSSEKDFFEMLDNIRTSNTGYNFEVAARLWYTTADANSTIMIEYQVATKDCRELLEDEYAPDWLTAYAVKDMKDTDVRHEICTQTANKFKNIDALRAEMLLFARKAHTQYCCKDNENLYSSSTQDAGDSSGANASTQNDEIANENRLKVLYDEVEEILNMAPCEEDCSEQENEVYSDMANLKESLFDLLFNKINKTD